jgi:NADH-quinone oxidoreductase subunit H
VDGVGEDLARAALVVATAFVALPLIAWLERALRPTPSAHRRRRSALHAFAVAVKLLEKRAAPAPGTDRTLHATAPLLALLPTMALLGLLPIVPALDDTPSFTGPAVGGLALVLALFALTTLSVALAGIAGSNRLALLDALRFIALRGSVLVVVGTAALSLARSTESLDLFDIADAQRATLSLGIPAWGLARAPLAFLAAVVATALLSAQTARMRTEVSLLEPWLIEASGPVLLGHRVWISLDLFAQAALLSSLFLGAGHVPGVTTGAGVVGLAAAIAKALFMAGAIVVLGGALPPLRHGDAVRVCWTLLVPLAGISLVVTELWHP